MEIYKIQQISKETVLAHLDDYVRLANLIPMVTFKKEDLLSEAKDGRILHGKWNYILGAFFEGKMVGFINGYEREKENTGPYQFNSLYMNMMAVAPEHRGKGLGKKLFSAFLHEYKQFRILDGAVVYTLQTNSAPWNAHLAEMYRSFGFKEIGTKEYDNRTDLVMMLDPRK
jgi:ribosomal protein S18 acetylase RimI-like enzyme